jgi:hypothetical protein
MINRDISGQKMTLLQEPAFLPFGNALVKLAGIWPNKSSLQ